MGTSLLIVHSIYAILAWPWEAQDLPCLAQGAGRPGQGAKGVP